MFKKSDESYDFSIQTIAEKIPVPPAWPDSVILSAEVGGCGVRWSPVEDAVAYRVYKRSKAEFLPETPSKEAPYALVFQCGGDDPGLGVEYLPTVDSTHWVDKGTAPTHRYWYYVTALNAQSVESSHFTTRTNPTPGDPTYGSISPFEKPPIKLDSVYVVPNPYHVKAIRLYGRQQNILDFVGLPAACRIRIFTQSSDLVETIDHEYQYPPSSTEIWELRTSMDQTIASGLYVYVVDRCFDNNNKPFTATKVGKFVVIR